MRLHIIPGIGNRKLKSLQASHIRAWLTGLQTRCQCCAQGKDAARGRKSQARCCALVPAKCCNDALSASSIRHILRVLRAALQDAVDEEMLSRNVARLVQLRVTDDRKVRSFTRLRRCAFSRPLRRRDFMHCGQSRCRWDSVVVRRSGCNGPTSI